LARSESGALMDWASGLREQSNIQLATFSSGTAQMTKGTTMSINEFKKKLRNLEPGRELIYHVGELAYDREDNDEVNQIAALALAVDECGAGACFQRKLPRRGYEYVVRVFRKLGHRKDGNGSYQEVLRVAGLQTDRIRI
jgi:hypothetical protein